MDSMKQVILKERSKRHNSAYDSEFPLIGIPKCAVHGGEMTISKADNNEKMTRKEY